MIKLLMFLKKYFSTQIKVSILYYFTSRVYINDGTFATHSNLVNKTKSLIYMITKVMDWTLSYANSLTDTYTQNLEMLSNHKIRTSFISPECYNTVSCFLGNAWEPRN